MALARGTLFNFALLFLLIQLSQRFNIGNNDDVIYLRVAFLVSQIAIYLLFTLISKRINSANDTTTLRWKPISSNGNSLITGTVREYDLEQLGHSRNQAIMSLVIIAVLHLYLGYVQPIFLQIFLPWTHILQSQLFKIHIRNCPPVDELKRPWPVGAQGLLSSLTENNTDNTVEIAAEENELENKENIDANINYDTNSNGDADADADADDEKNQEEIEPVGKSSATEQKTSNVSKVNQSLPKMPVAAESAETTKKFD